VAISGVRNREASKLHQEIDKLTKSLAGRKDLKKTLEDAEEQISSWWNTVVKMVQEIETANRYFISGHVWYITHRCHPNISVHIFVSGRGAHKQGLM